MSTDLYRIQVLEKAGLTIKLRVTIVYDDIRDTPAADSQGFFLSLLWDESRSSRPRAPIAKAVSVEQILSWEFRRDHERDFVAHVERLASANFPVSRNRAYRAKERDYDKLAYTDYLVTVTDEQWTAHLAPGKSWGSTSFEGRGY